VTQSAERLWLCDDRGVTEVEVPWLSLPEDQILPTVMEAAEAAGYSPTLADGLAAYLWRKKRGLASGRTNVTRTKYRRILAELGPPAPAPAGSRRRRRQDGYATIRTLTRAGGLSSVALVAAGGHPPALLACPIILVMLSRRSESRRTRAARAEEPLLCRVTVARWRPLWGGEPGRVPFRPCRHQSTTAGPVSPGRPA
jgi:hypothetical protein